MPKSTLWITESDGVEMRSVYAAYEVHPETAGMCLNKPDKNGNIAYVGDRVHDENYGDGEIKYDADKGLYYIKFYEDLDHDLRALSWLEIIGNIHDQP